MFRRDWAYVESGMPVWAVIAYLESYGWNIDRTVAELGGAVTHADVAFASEYYKSHRGEIDAKLAEIA